MIFNLIAEGMTVGVLIAIIACGIVVLGLAIFGIVLAVREPSHRAKKHSKAPATVVVQEKYYDFTNLSEEEKDLIRKHRDKAL